MARGTVAEEFSVLTDLEGCLSAVSADAHSIVGRSDKDICAKPLFDLFNKEDREKVVEILQNASDGKDAKLSGIPVRVEGTHQLLFDIAMRPEDASDKFFVFFILVAGEVAPLPWRGSRSFG
jgi:hypothetical protein